MSYSLYFQLQSDHVCVTFTLLEVRTCTRREVKESIDTDGITRHFVVSPSAPAWSDHRRERYRSFP